MAQFLPEGFAATDWILIAVLVFFALLKGSRGLYDSLMPLAVTLISIAGAAIVTMALTERVTEAVYPLAVKELGSRMDLSAIRTTGLAEITSQLGKLLPNIVTSLLRKMNLQLRPFVDAAAEALPKSAAGSRIAEDAVSAFLLPITRGVVQVTLFFLAFFLIRALLTIVQRAAGLAFDLPVIRVVNRLGGFALGFAECAIVLYLLLWLLDLFSPALFARLAEGSKLIPLVFK